MYGGYYSQTEDDLFIDDNDNENEFSYEPEPYDVWRDRKLEEEEYERMNNQEE